MIFENEIYKTIDELNNGSNPYNAIINLLEAYNDANLEKKEEGMQDIMSFLVAANNKYNLEFINGSINNIRARSNLSFNHFNEYIRNVLTEAYSGSQTLYKRQREAFFANLLDSSEYMLEFSDEDHSRLQTLINELRETIANYAGFEEEHKSRLLARLEKLQSELHKKVSDVDRFWGLVGDAGLAIGKFGEDAKPIVDRIREIAGIVFKTQCEAEGIEAPSEIPLLESQNK